MTRTTKAQRMALLAVYRRGEINQARSYREFRKRVLPMFAGDGAVIVPWAGMWLAIEADGYTHS